MRNAIEWNHLNFVFLSRQYSRFFTLQWNIWVPYGNRTHDLSNTSFSGTPLQPKVARAEHHCKANLVIYQCKKIWFWRQRTYTCTDLEGRVRVVPRQPDLGRRMSSFLGGKSRGAFRQPVQHNDCSTVLKKKYLVSIYGKKKFKRILSCLFWWKAKSSSYEICLQRLHLCCRFCCELGQHNAWVRSILHRSWRQI